MKTTDLVQTALFAALICVSAPLSVPLFGVPLSCATFAVMMAGAVLKEKGVLSVGLYLIMGMIGLPVFAGFSGGIGSLIGMTGGYLIGYLPLAYACALAFRNRDSQISPLPKMLIGTLVLYAIGTGWFVFVTKMRFTASLAICVYPFLPGDLIKIVAVLKLAPVVEKRLSRSSVI